MSLLEPSLKCSVLRLNWTWKEKKERKKEKKTDVGLNKFKIDFS